MPSLHWDRQFAMEQVDGDEDLLQELLVILKKSCSSDMELIKQGLDTQRLSQVQHGAHSIKGAAASLGISALRDMAWSIELEAKHGRLVGVEERFLLLTGLIEELGKI